MSQNNQPQNGLDDYEPDILTLEDESGQEHVFEVLDAADMNDNRYLAMVPYHADPAESLADDAEMIVMKVSEEDGEEVLDVIEDEEELYQAGQMFLTRLSEVYDIDLDELAKELENE